MKSIRTPLGVTLPSVVYAALVSLAITLGSVLTMARLGLPWWAWVIQFVLLLGIAYGITENNATPAAEGVFTVTDARTLALAGKGLLLFLVVSVGVLVLWSE